MNVNMWEHPATQQNVALLRQRGVRIVDPDSGYLACGMVGAGRLAANESIVSAVMDALHASQELAGETVLVTAGPTREPLDPVRFIGNRSSGKMGYALAAEALRMGARVILVSGPTALQPPSGAILVQVETAEQMRNAVLERLQESTIVIKAAAVSDFTVKAPAPEKIKRKSGLSLDLQPTTDILAEIGRTRSNQLVIGFAAETQDVLANARKKLESKNIDAIVANDVSRPGLGFDSDQNAATIITAAEAIELQPMSKTEMARQVLKFVARLRASRPQQRVGSGR
jgi:phosphopantothenoylcysteine decarboxylase/phosphopantothenate--cysteine ligase